MSEEDIELKILWIVIKQSYERTGESPHKNYNPKEEGFEDTFEYFKTKWV